MQTLYVAYLLVYHTTVTNFFPSIEMPWKETSPGRFERPFDGIERFYRAVASAGGPLEQWSITTVAQIRLNLPASDKVAALQHAWTALRYDHPQIACTEQSDTNVYEVPDEAALATWIKDTFIVEHSQTANNLLSTFNRSPSATLHYLPQTSEVAIHCSHSRMDGIGALHLLHQLFKALAEPRSISFGTESKNLSPGLFDAAGIPTDVTPEIQQAVTGLITNLASSQPSLGLPTIASNQIPGPTQRRELKFGTHKTDTVVKACKDRGLGITAAVHAALILATQQLSPPELAGRKYTSWCLVNLRPYCQPPYDSATYPVALYHGASVMSIAPSSFLQDALELQSVYKQSWQPSQSTLLTNLSHFIETLAPMLGQPPPPNIEPPSEPLLSSLGVVDRYIQPRYGDEVEVNDFWMAIEMLTRQVELHVWTFHDDLTLSATFNENFYEGEFIESFLSRIQAILLKGLNVEDAK